MYYDVANMLTDEEKKFYFGKRAGIIIILP